MFCRGTPMCVPFQQPIQSPFVGADPCVCPSIWITNQYFMYSNLGRHIGLPLRVKYLRQQIQP